MYNDYISVVLIIKSLLLLLLLFEILASKRLKNRKRKTGTYIYGALQRSACRKCCNWRRCHT
jgi:hypothetical protein